MVTTSTENLWAGIPGSVPQALPLPLAPPLLLLEGSCSAHETRTIPSTRLLLPAAGTSCSVRIVAADSGTTRPRTEVASAQLSEALRLNFFRSPRSIFGDFGQPKFGPKFGRPGFLENA